MSIKRAVEKTKEHGLRIKPPKTKHGLKLGLGKLPAAAFVFGNINGAVRDPDRITQDWKRAARGLPRVRLPQPSPQPR